MDSYFEQQRAMRITAAESLLRDELKKPNPSPVSLAAFRQAAYGDESVGESKSSAGWPVVEEVLREKGTDVLSRCTETIERNLQMDVEESLVETEVTAGDEGGIVLSDDAAMSIGDSEEDETGTDGFSVVDGSSSGEESVVSRTSRKWMAEESPEREPVGMNRKEFLGAVTRSEGGCRIYGIPPHFE